MNPNQLDALVEKARPITMTPQQRERQLLDFAYGNAKVDNKNISRQSIRTEAVRLGLTNDGGNKD